MAVRQWGEFLVSLKTLFLIQALIQNMSVRVLAFWVLLGLTLSQCPPNYAIPNLLAGSVQFAIKSSVPDGSQKYQYAFSSPFSSIPGVALALQDFSVSSLSSHSFRLSPTKITTSSIFFNFTYTVPIWSSIRFNFWASANPQLQLGYYSNSNLNLTGNSATLTTSIQQAFTATDNPVIRVFLNGYQAQSNAIQVAVNPFNLQNTTLSIKVVLGPTTKLTGIWLSWIAFSPVSASFSSFGGSFGRGNFIGEYKMDISSNLYQNSYLLYGLSQLSINGKEPLTYSCQISNSFELSLASSRNFDSLGIVYVAAGNAPGKLCSACGAATIAYVNSCLTSCPLGTTPNTYKDGGVACLGTALSSPALTNSSLAVPTSESSPVSIPIPIFLPTPPRAPASSSSSGGRQNQCQKDVECPRYAFFNGNQCVCQVGYFYTNGSCNALPIVPLLPVNLSPAATASLATCNSTTIPLLPYNPPNTPTSSVYPASPASPTSPTPDTPISPLSIALPLPTFPTQPKPCSPVSSNCPNNSYNNGLGTCVCNSGFYFSPQGTCIQGTPCPANSTRQPNGSCQCDTGLTNFNGFCSKCPSGAFWSSQTNSCIFVCGQNAIYDNTAGTCVCNPGYGFLSGQCSSCQGIYFLSNGYCVTCPVNSLLNPNTFSCECQVGYYTNQYGICTQKCLTNEVYDSSSLQCVCLKGLARVSGVCTMCPSGTKASADGSSCSFCGDNQQLVGSQCVCAGGYALNPSKVCTPCSKLPSGFLINGLCSVCPNNLVYNGNHGCSCPAGKVLQGSVCVSLCRSDELLDSQGNCYTCGNNQLISNGQCVCSKGFTLVGCGICVLNCAANQFVFQGACASCPLNTVYNPQINGCSCPSNYYKDSNGVCQQLVLKPISCQAGQYYDSTQGCITCPGSCLTCKSPTQCLTCSTRGYTPNPQGMCVPICGDGLILADQTCDTGLNYSAGCIGCRVQPNWVCSGQPSVCMANNTLTPPTPTPLPTPYDNGITDGSISGLGNLAPLYLSGTPTVNSNNVFITLKTNPTFTFDTPTEMQNFLKPSFPPGPKPTVYCSQRVSPNLDTFDCLMLFPSGVPNQNFTVNFSYNYKSRSGAATVNVDPFAVSKATATGRRN